MEPVLSDPDEDTKTEESENIESMSELESNGSGSSEPGDDFETASDSSSRIMHGSRWVPGHVVDPDPHHFSFWIRVRMS